MAGTAWHCRRLDPARCPTAQLLLVQLDLIPLAGAVIEQACNIGGPTLRSRDALLLASALTIGADLSAFVVYDHRLTASALDADLLTLRPGA
jgi:predicted nucleic acid-binding protein